MKKVETIIQEQLYGVNLGGWLLLERWITPSLFEGVIGKDETSFIRQLGETESARRLMKHHAEFITEADFANMAEHGINAVRIPVGWWIFNDEAPYIGNIAVLDKALNWAQHYNIKVLIDLHGLPGSQNGKVHSGNKGTRLWHRSPAFQERSLWIIERLTRRYVNHPALWGLQVINEPEYLTPSDVLADYYRAALITVRRSSPSLKVILSDAFWGEGILPHISDFVDKHTVLDIHLYQVYTTADQKMSLSDHIYKTEHEWHDQLKRLSTTMPIIVGEWSAAMSEFYEPQLVHQKNYKQQAYKQYAHAQQRIFKSSSLGWFYWTYKTERKDVWSLGNRLQYLVK